MRMTISQLDQLKPLTLIARVVVHSEDVILLLLYSIVYCCTHCFVRFLCLVLVLLCCICVISSSAINLLGMDS